MLIYPRKSFHTKSAEFHAVSSLCPSCVAKRNAGWTESHNTAIRSLKVQSLGEWREAVVKLDRTSYSEHHHQLRYRSVFSILMQKSPMKKLESIESRRSELQNLFMFPPLSVLDQATAKLRQTASRVFSYLLSGVSYAPSLLLFTAKEWNSLITCSLHLNRKRNYKSYWTILIRMQRNPSSCHDESFFFYLEQFILVTDFRMHRKMAKL